MKTLRTLLIGAGNIAGAKPMAKPGGPVVTHIQAIMADKRFRLYGVVDTNLTAAAGLITRWNVGSEFCGAYKSVADAALDVPAVDLVVIATPPSTHRQIVFDIFTSTLAPRMILLEKPGGTSLSEALEIDFICATNDCKLFLNYQRNYCPQINADLIKRTIGKPVYAQCDYVRGLRNDASHGIALFQKLFGTTCLYNNRPMAYRRTIEDLPGDPTILAAYGLQDCEVGLIGHDGRMFDIFEITIYGTLGKIVFMNHGQEIVCTGITDEEVYGCYKKLKDGSEKIGKADLSLSNVYNTIAEDGNPLMFVDYLNIWHTISQIESALSKTI